MISSLNQTKTIINSKKAIRQMCGMN